MPHREKCDSRLNEELKKHAVTPAREPIRVIVKWKPAASAQAVSAASQIQGCSAPSKTFKFVPASAHTATPNAIDSLTDRDDVERVWFDDKVTTRLDQSVPLIGAPRVWEQGFTGKGVKVAIIDTGVDANHPDLVGRLAKTADFTGEGHIDNHGHGTHVAGIVGGSGAASNGTYKGVAPECTFFSAKVLAGNGAGTFSSVMAGVEWAVAEGTQVLNLSLGADGSCDGTDPMALTCDEAVRRGAVVCVAAGNSGPGSATIGTPGCAKLVMTVGATDKLDQIAVFSSRGPTSDGRVTPEICFPGVSIIAARARNTSTGTPVGQHYTTLSGTSMATPHAAGSSALLLEKDSSLTPAEVLEALSLTARNLGLDPNTQGAGRGDVYQASFMRVIKEVEFTPTIVNPGDVINVRITVFNGSKETLQTQGPTPGFVYEEEETFYTRGFPEVPGAFRVGIEFEGRTGVDHPYRWGLGAPLAPGETATVTGSIRMKIPQARNYWAGLVQEQIAWMSDRRGITRLTVQSPTPVPPGTVNITGVTFVPLPLSAGNYLIIAIAVHNGSSLALTTQGPDPGFIYEEGETFETRGLAAKTGAFRVGLDFDGRVGIDHPYRWGTGTPLLPGQSTIVTGAVHLLKSGSKKYWAGAVQEYIAWLQDNRGTQTVTVKPGPTITSVTFTPTTVPSGQLLSLNITLRNDSDTTIQTQDPNPGFTYEEGDMFLSRGFSDKHGTFRVGVDFDRRSGIDHPYRWGLGAPLAPGQTATITGTIRLRTPQSQNYWAGLVQEQVAWLQDRQGTELINVTE